MLHAFVAMHRAFLGKCTERFVDLARVMDLVKDRR
jgi:hypothetical protein